MEIKRKYRQPATMEEGLQEVRGYNPRIATLIEEVVNLNKEFSISSIEVEVNDFDFWVEENRCRTQRFKVEGVGGGYPGRFELEEFEPNFAAFEAASVNHRPRPGRAEFEERVAELRSGPAFRGSRADGGLSTDFACLSGIFLTVPHLRENEGRSPRVLRVESAQDIISGFVFLAEQDREGHERNVQFWDQQISELQAVLGGGE